MKIRNGFVSNSSSSSFVCRVCGNTAGGYDVSLRDFDMTSCERGHCLCNHHLDDYLKCEEKKELQDWEKENGDDEVPEKFCPICRLRAIDPSDLVKYLLKRAGKTEAEVTMEICDEHGGNLKSFKESLK